RNGYGRKKLKTDMGEAEIKVPRDRDSNFELLLFLKGGNMAKGVENVIISLYAKGMSNEDIREQFEEIYNFELSSSAISRITDRITDDITACQNRSLESFI